MTEVDIMSELAGDIGLDSSDTQESATETTAAESSTTVQQTSSGNYQIQLTKDNFVKFSNALTIIQNICNDCDIVNGHIRCRTNDRKNGILMDLSSILEEKSIMFSNLKSKLLQLATFSIYDDSSDGSILIESNDSNFEFSDSLIKLKMRKPIKAYIDNPYLEDSEFSVVSNGATNDNLLFSYTVSSIERKRIAKLCDLLGSNTVMFEFYGDTCTFKVQNSSKDNVSETTKTIPLSQNLAGKKSNVNSLNFTLDTPSGLTINCYIVHGELVFKNVLDYYGIPIEIWTKARVNDINDND